MYTYIYIFIFIHFFIFFVSMYCMCVGVCLGGLRVHYQPGAAACLRSPVDGKIFLQVRLVAFIWRWFEIHSHRM